MTWFYNSWGYIQYLFQGTYTLKVLIASWDLLGQLWYSVALGIFLAALLSLHFSPARIRAFLTRFGARAILAAAVLGAISPLPTYTMVPLAGSLLLAGVPAAPLLAFMISSPLINPILFSLTAGAFGLEMAMMRLAASLTLGIGGGLLALALPAQPATAATAMEGEWAAARPAEARFPSREYFRLFGRHLYRNSLWIGRVFLFSLVIAAITKELIPAALVARVLGGSSPLSISLAVLAGIPLYACGGGAIPVMEVLAEKGMSHGAILAFFISGPATKFSTLAALLIALPRRLFWLYCLVTLGGALVFGLAYGLVR